jgi:hypothetical protein
MFLVSGSKTIFSLHSRNKLEDAGYLPCDAVFALEEKRIRRFATWALRAENIALAHAAKRMIGDESAVILIR